MNTTTIKKLMEIRKISVKEAALKLKMSEQGVYHLLKNAKDLKVGQLEIFAEMLDVDIQLLLKDDLNLGGIKEPIVNYQKINGDNNNLSNGHSQNIELQKELENCKKMVEEKERHIQALQNTINIIQKLNL